MLFFVNYKKKDINTVPEIERCLNAFSLVFEKLIRSEFVNNRKENNHIAKENREEIDRISRENRYEQGRSFRQLSDLLEKIISGLSNNQKDQFENFSNNQENLRKTIDLKLKDIQEENSKQLNKISEETTKKLDQMRKVVDDNLKDTVEKRFNDSFKLISERLEQVHSGLGEMKHLASGVGDLRKVLTNVKTKGNLGEIQLGSILEQILCPKQFESQKSVKNDNNERVDYVVKIPDKNSLDEMLLLPIDSKFPTENYQRLIEAYDNSASEDELRTISNNFESSVKKCAKSIYDKYINPPVTTDFAIMFVPTEGLYAEIVRRVNLFWELQIKYKVTVVGPSNLSAFLSSLQMGFRTLTIECRSNEVRELLGAVKTEFGKFGILIKKIKDKIDSAAREVDRFGARSRSIERKLRDVEELPSIEQKVVKKDTGIT
ncbi:MAG: DNA recombination protein RmuC [Firmicutes bacterium]|nr:DNA recombination protein RmuC [Bacillota bacterium]